MTTEEKRVFIKWFLGSFNLKRRESTWILHYLMTHEEVLKKVHFVEQAQFCPKGLVISATCVDDVPFRYYSNGKMTTDAEFAFRHIRDQESDVYVELKFSDKSSISYLKVLEENTFVPVEQRASKNDPAIVENFLEFSLYQHNRKHILRKIDDALLHNDKEGFKKANAEYKKLKRVTKKFELVSSKL